MYHLRSDTLAAYKGRLMFQMKDMGGRPVQDMVHQMNSYFDLLPGQILPETAAIKFYLLNHSFAALQSKFDQHEPLGQHEYVAKQYVNEGAAIMQRLFYYMMLITTRESRHVNVSGLHEKMVKAFVKNGMKAEQAAEVAQKSIDYADGLPNGSDSAAQHLRKHPIDMPLGLYLEGMMHIFNCGKFSGGFGGKPWGKIAETAWLMVRGKISPEIMMDTAWALAHNNGPMFNKGMLYQHYTGEIIKILDVQRSGQIPAMLNEGFKTGVTPEVAGLFMKCKELLPEIVGGGFVDWFKVEELGAVKTYPDEKKKQEMLHGKVKAKPKAADAQLFFIAPNVAVKVIQRKPMKKAA